MCDYKKFEKRYKLILISYKEKKKKELRIGQPEYLSYLNTHEHHVKAI